MNYWTLFGNWSLVRQSKKKKNHFKQNKRSFLCLLPPFIYTLLHSTGGRNRLRDGTYNLDLTYITPRIIAMGLPSSGLEGTYRNHIDRVHKT